MKEQGGTEGLIQVAEMFFDLGIAKKCVPLLKKAIELDPDDPRPYRYLGLINRDTFVSINTALDYLKKYIERAPNDPFGYHYVSVVYWRMASQKKDKSFYNKAAESMNRYAELFNNKVYGYKKMGYFYYLAGNYKEAIKYFKKVLEYEPMHEYANRMLRKISGKEKE